MSVAPLSERGEILDCSGIRRGGADIISTNTAFVTGTMWTCFGLTGHNAWRAIFTGVGDTGGIDDVTGGGALGVGGTCGFAFGSGAAPRRGVSMLRGRTATLVTNTGATRHKALETNGFGFQYLVYACHINVGTSAALAHEHVDAFEHVVCKQTKHAKRRHACGL